MRVGEAALGALMQASQAGDAAAHGALLRALLPLLRRYFRNRLRGLDDIAEDLVQEVLIAVHEKRSTYDPSRPLGGWLYAIARYKHIDFLRRRGDRVTSLHDLEEDFLAAADESEASDAQMDLDTLLATLSPKQAKAIRATHLQGYSVAEAADQQQLSASDVKVSVHRGLKALAALIRGDRR